MSTDNTNVSYTIHTPRSGSKRPELAVPPTDVLNECTMPTNGSQKRAQASHLGSSIGHARDALTAPRAPATPRLPNRVMQNLALGAP